MTNEAEVAIDGIIFYLENMGLRLVRPAAMFGHSHVPLGRLPAGVPTTQSRRIAMRTGVTIDGVVLTRGQVLRAMEALDAPEQRKYTAVVLVSDAPLKEYGGQGLKDWAEADIVIVAGRVLKNRFGACS